MTADLNEAKALDFMDKAERSMNSYWPFGSGKYEKAQVLYESAGNHFRMAHKSQEAGDAFLKSAECFIKLGPDSKHDVANAYINAAKCYRKVSPQEAINTLKLACEIQCEMGRFAIAAKHEWEIAEIYEEDKNIEETIIHYEISASYYENENAITKTNSALLKVALYESQLEKYEKAIGIYEKVVINSLDNSQLKANVKDYFLHAGICHLCIGNMESANSALRRYQDLDVVFSTTIECDLLTELYKTYEQQDIPAFVLAISKFDKRNKLSTWMVTLLLRVKTTLQRNEDSLV